MKRPPLYLALLFVGAVVLAACASAPHEPPPPPPPQPRGDQTPQQPGVPAIHAVDVRQARSGAGYLSGAGDADPRAKPGDVIAYAPYPRPGYTLRLSFPSGWPFEGRPDGTDGEGAAYLDVTEQRRVRLSDGFSSECPDAAGAAVPNCVEYVARIVNTSTGASEPVGGVRERSRPRIIIDR